ncbi:hypothetical protein BGZ70_001895 [Mortierella alpina]|uniref:Uncharacterized protein n=1 Tax=Mortierella alpina TaxID=64518 RepID=A0A9P6M501_MORAP|nr:hypothetical protein BGZ70_001895 [Mortierella alpina]
MSPTDRSTHSRPQDQVLVQIAPGPRPRPTSSIPLPSSPSVNTVKSEQEHDAVATNQPHKEDRLVDRRDSKSCTHQLYHIDSDPNISTHQHLAHLSPSFKDATMIDMTEYPLDRNEDKEEDITRTIKGDYQLAHYGQHHPLQSQPPHPLASNKVDTGSQKVDGASFREPSEQQSDSIFLQEQATHQHKHPSSMQHPHPNALSLPESIPAATAGGERGSVSVLQDQQQQSDVLYPQHESGELSESTTSDSTQENQPKVACTAGDQQIKLHTTPSTSALTDPPSAAITTFHSHDGGSTTTPTASAAAAAAAVAAVSIVVTGVDTKPQRQQQQQQQRPQQTQASSLFDFFRGRKTSIPKTIKTSLDSGYHRPGATNNSSSSIIISPNTTNTNTNMDTSIHYSNFKPSNPINKRETIGSLPLPTRIDRSMGASNRTSYASSHSTSSALAHSHNSSGGGGGGNLFTAADSVPSEDPTAGAKTGTSASRQVSAVSTTAILTPTPTPSSSTHTGSTVSSHSIASSAHSTLTKVAAAVVGATVGKRRPMAATGLSSSISSSGHGETDLGQTSHRLGLVGGGGGGGGGAIKASQQPPPQQPSSLQRQRQSMTTTTTRSVPELREYISQLYKTILGKDEAFEYSQKQLGLLRSELDRVRSHAEEEKKELVDEMDRTKEQIVTMEENFLLWRTKVHNDQATLQDNLLNERLDKQDRIEELEEDLNASQEEADRLRSRLLVLEYEEGYHGPSSFLPDDSVSGASSPNSSRNSSRTGSNSSHRGSSVSIAIEHGPMTVDTHRRRSADFTLLEQRAQSFEALVQDLRRTLELERQQHQRELKTIRMQSQARFDKLEHDLQAAKMEATMYAEMMHEVVAENDDLRSRVKSASRLMRRHGWTDLNKKNSGDNSNSNSSSNGGKNSSVVVSASTSRSNSQGSASDRRRHRSRPRNSDHFGFPGGMDYSDSESDDGSEDGMEEIAI